MSNPSTQGAPLSLRELQLLRLLADGHTIATAARHLQINAHTVKSFRVTLGQKLGARSTGHAVALGYRHGYLAVDPADLADFELVRQAREMGRRIALVPLEDA